MRLEQLQREAEQYKLEEEIRAAELRQQEEEDAMIKEAMLRAEAIRQKIEAEEQKKREIEMELKR